ncbi:MAG: cupin domain-containing protein [Vicinamibacterales bacterium]
MKEEVFQRLTGATPEHFFSAPDLERHHKLIERSGLLPGDLVDRDAIDFLISHPAMSYPFIRIVNHGREILPEHYLRRPIDAEFRLVDPDRVLSFYRNGSTIIFQKSHLWTAKLARLTGSLQRSLLALVNCNIYVTPAGSKGFAPHFDTHDVFIYQVSGEKIWNIYDAPRELPLESESLSAKESGDYLHRRPSVELTLRQGNLLYVPKGLVHDTFTRSTESVHVTIGIFPPRGVDLLRAVTDQASQRPFFRRAAFTSRESGSTGAGVSQRIVDEFADVTTELLGGEALSRFREERFLTVPTQEARGRFSDLLSVETMQLDTRMHRRASIPFQLSPGTPGKIELRFYDKRVVFPAFVEDDLKFVAGSQGTFSVGDIAGRLDDAGRLVLAKTLIREGFLTLQPVD